ncbi:hypothetical protein ACFZDK_31740 [Streptomyces sp. NPDC007901]|uniref:hypothetical protein n=1 Tax=Streptomyces sp. NPDC007901 TaxID=3364785 RepID=UPI0036E9DC22
MQHRRPRLSKKAKTLLSAAVALAAAAGVGVAQAGESSKKCTAFDTVTLGKYYVDNNLWGQDKGTGSQCVWDNSRSTGRPPGCPSGSATARRSPPCGTSPSVRTRAP